MTPQPILISTDFDGTIAGPPDGKPFAEPFMEWLREARAHRPVTWVINTGRDWESLSAELIARNSPIWPDWVVLIERYVCKVENRKQIPLQKWNHACDRAHDELFPASEALFNRIREKFETRSGVQLIKDPGSPLGIITESEGLADRVAVFLEQTLPPTGKLRAVRNSIYFRFAHRDFNKGTSLEAVGGELGITPTRTFAAGDHYNDLPMLRLAYARQLACPGNAVPEVKNRVREQGGFVAKSVAADGIAQALEYFHPRH